MKSQRLRKNLSRFRKKKIEFDKYVKDFYIENGLAVISCNIKSYYDVISPYSVNGYEWLNPHFAAFIEENANYIPTEYPIVIEICGGGLNQKQRQTIEETIADYYALKLGDKQLAIDSVAKKCWVELVGAITSGLIYYFGPDDSALTSPYKLLFQALTIVFWLAVWDLIETVVFELHEAKEQKTEAAQLASMKVIFNDVFVDEPFNKREEQMIIHDIFGTDAT